MQTRNELEQKLHELQNHYQACLLEKKEFDQLKAIKNNIKKIYSAMNGSNRSKS